MKKITSMFFGIPISIVTGFLFWLFIIENRFCTVFDHTPEQNKCWFEPLFSSLMKGWWPYDDLNNPPYLELFLIMVIIFAIWCGISSFVKTRQLKIK